METTDDLMRATEAALRQPALPPYRLSSIALRLYLLTAVHHLADVARVARMRQQFHDALARAEAPDVLTHQIRYALRLANAPGPLIYEEMHKLFSLCDEIHALRSLGLPADDALLRQFDRDVRRRFAAQPNEARLAAEYNVADWSRPLWWYAENLDDRTPPRT